MGNANISASTRFCDNLHGDVYPVRLLAVGLSLYEFMCIWKLYQDDSSVGRN